MEKFEMPEIEAMRIDFDKFITEANSFIKRQNGYGNQDKI